MNCSDLFSIVILCENNFSHIKQTIESVFEQEYPNIELIITDNASADFDEISLIAYCNSKRGPNLNNIYINQNSKPLPLCKHINSIFQKCTGNCITFITAGDTYADSQVIYDIVAFANNDKTNQEVIVSQGVFCNANLNAPYMSVSNNICRTFNADHSDLFFYLAINQCFCLQNCTFRRDVLLSIFSKNLNDDSNVAWSLFFYCLEIGIKFVYFDRDIPPIKINKPGILFDSKPTLDDIIVYYKDIITIYDKEILPYAKINFKKSCFGVVLRYYYYYSVFSLKVIKINMEMRRHEEHLKEIQLAEEQRQKIELSRIKNENAQVLEINRMLEERRMAESEIKKAKIFSRKTTISRWLAVDRICSLVSSTTSFLLLILFLQQQKTSYYINKTIGVVFTLSIFMFLVIIILIILKIIYFLHSILCKKQ